jgi:protein-S-isoprenylcysteine O-methyltransferase Ste14
MVNLLKSFLHNIGVVIVGLALAYLGTMVDWLLGAPAFSFPLVKVAGLLLLALGFLVRVWATVYFYAHKMRVISLKPQTRLITSGPYRFSRNPLYLVETCSLSSEPHCSWDCQRRFLRPLFTSP